MFFPSRKNQEGTAIKRSAIYLLGLAVLAGMLFASFGRTHQGAYSLADVKSIEEIEPSEEMEEGDRLFNVSLEIVSGPMTGQHVTVRHEETQSGIYNLPIEVGNRIVIWTGEEENGEKITGIDEFYKSRRILGLILFLIAIIIVISGSNGLKALFALAVTLIMLFAVLCGLLVKGYPPMLMGVATAVAITLCNMIIIAGWNRKALSAGIGTIGGTICAGLFAWIASGFLHLTGYTGHESQYLQLLEHNVDLKGIMVCGILIGALGAVMDVAISISSSMQEIRIANPSLTRDQLFNSGMNVGRDIIGSMTNTLILAYAGASLTLILVFSLQQEDFPLLKIMNMEFIASEIIRSIAGLFGMVLAIPLTAVIASHIFTSHDMKR